MKAASGELNLTVITLIAISAVLAFFWLMWPSIENTVKKQWNDISTNDKSKNHITGVTPAPAIQNYVFEVR